MNNTLPPYAYSNVTLEVQPILDTLVSATGLDWSTPPAQPSHLRNGYHVEVPLLIAPTLVRRLQEAAIHASGRQRAIVFEVCSRGRAIINIPKEIAELKGFCLALSSLKVPEHSRLH